MTAEDYILKHAQGLPMAMHLDLARAFDAGRMDGLSERRFAMQREQDLTSALRELAIAVAERMVQAEPTGPVVLRLMAAHRAAMRLTEGLTAPEIKPVAATPSPEVTP